MTLAILEGVCSDKKLSTIDQLYEYRYIIAMELIFLRYLFILTFSSGNERDGGEARKMKMKKKKTDHLFRGSLISIRRDTIYTSFPPLFFFLYTFSRLPISLFTYNISLAIRSCTSNKIKNKKTSFFFLYRIPDYPSRHLILISAAIRDLWVPRRNNVTFAAPKEGTGGGRGGW